MANNLWTENELILALNLYLKLPFGKFHVRTPEIIHLANIVGRTPASVAMRLSNFAHVDPFYQEKGIKGLSNGKNQVEPIWNKFINNKEELLFESERILAEYEHKTIEIKFKDILLGTENLQGETKVREVKTRVNQGVFRQIVLANYSGKCAVTGIDIPDLLIASHILPWSQHINERLNPQNGICLSPLYDKCFDKGLISIDPDYKILISKTLKESAAKSFYKNAFESLEGKKINLPIKFLPKKEFLDYHYINVFLKK